jgi:hypothetical protein
VVLVQTPLLLSLLLLLRTYLIRRAASIFSTFLAASPL